MADSYSQWEREQRRLVREAEREERDESEPGTRLRRSDSVSTSQSGRPQPDRRQLS
jgi:hypothetical protein